MASIGGPRQPLPALGERNEVQVAEESTSYEELRIAIACLGQRS